ncbi:hypothetical protein NKH18_29020 [Streptomyces sp. M10(2022)]
MRPRRASWAAVPGRALFAPGMWSSGRIAGEALLSLTFVLLTVGAELLGDESAVRAIGAGLGAGLLSLLRRALPRPCCW